MKPNMTPKQKPEQEPKLKVLSAEVERENAQAELQKVLDKMERMEEFSDPESNAIMCNTCCRVCVDHTYSSQRRAYPDVGGSFVCNECLCNNGAER